MASDIFVTQATAPPLKLKDSVSRNLANNHVIQTQGIEQNGPIQTGKMEEEKVDFQGNALQVDQDVLTDLHKEQEKEDKLNEKLTRLNDFAQNLHRDLQFSIHKESGRMVVTVIDSDTEEIIRKIPPDDVLKIAESLENLSGLLFKEQA